MPPDALSGNGEAAAADTLGKPFMLLHIHTPYCASTAAALMLQSGYTVWIQGCLCLCHHHNHRNTDDASFAVKHMDTRLHADTH